jgi:hypothetical protein
MVLTSEKNRNSQEFGYVGGSWIPAFAGVTLCLDSRVRGNDLGYGLYHAALEEAGACPEPAGGEGALVHVVTRV